MPRRPDWPDLTPTLPTCGACYMIVCEHHKRIIEQCECTSARKKRTDVSCPGCWGQFPLGGLS